MSAAATLAELRAQIRALEGGARVVLSARRRERLDALAEELRGRGAQAEVVPLDMALPADITAAVASCPWPVDLLVNNAGIGQRSAAVDTDMATVRRIMEVNFFGLVQLTTAVLPGMLARGGGQVVNISSISGHVATPRRSTYAASKHAVRAWSDALRAEVRDRGVQVTVACPGYVRTAFATAALRGDGTVNPDAEVRGLTADDAAARILRATAQGRREVLFGGKEVAAAYLMRWMPGLTQRLLPLVAPR